MQFKISTASPKKTTILIVNDAVQLATTGILNPEEIAFATAEIKQENKLICINQYRRFVYICVLPDGQKTPVSESLRRMGCTLKDLLHKE